jgi:hypothetical protein
MPGPWNSQGKGRRTRQGKEVIVSIHNHGYTNWMWDWTWTCSLVYHQLFRLLVGRGDVGSSIMYYRWIPCIAFICCGSEDDGILDKTKDYLSPKRLFALLNILPTPRLVPVAVVPGCSFGFRSLSPCRSLIAIPVVASLPPLSVSLTSVGVLE